MRLKPPPELDALKAAWQAAWPRALACWGPFTKIAEPRWCLTPADEKRQKLHGSFAMIRLVDHAVVISLRQIVEQQLEAFPCEILAHEIGHHVYCPADLNDDARLIARTRAGLPTRENMSGMISNLYTDLLINDRLRRCSSLNMHDVYRALAQPGADRLWLLYMRIYEILWSLQRGTLARGHVDAVMECDAGLGARVIRNYAAEWLDGAGRFASLCLPYLLEQSDAQVQRVLAGWSDTAGAAEGGEPTGLAGMDEGEIEGAIHPADDPDMTGLDGDASAKSERPPPKGRAVRGGNQHNNTYREPADYIAIMKAAGITLDEHELTIRYYRERALPHLVKLPERHLPQAGEPLPEGLDLWEAGAPVEDIDWTESIVRNPVIIPGITTLQRQYGDVPGKEPARRPADLYIGVDCSGSMHNPAFATSYPVLAGVIMALSALRAGARVMACLSGEPGKHTATGGFVSDAHDILELLTGYLGTGYAFGIERLLDIAPLREKRPEPYNLIIISDHDMFSMLDNPHRGRSGWDIARDTLALSRGNGTYVLHLDARSAGGNVQRMQNDGWDTSFVMDWADIVTFARDYSRKHYGRRPS